MSEPSIKVGVIADQTGPLSVMGIANANVARMVVDDINARVGGKGIFLLHIYEFEALIMAHIAPFNKLYKCACKPQPDPMRIVDPKGKLQEASRKGARGKYSENDCEEVCRLLDYAELVRNCGYFRDFDAAFAAKLPK